MTASSFPAARGDYDPFALLTAKPPIEFRKGAILYSELRQPAHLHVVVSGRVMVTRGRRGRRVVIDVYGPEDFFGECALADPAALPEQAVAIDHTAVMRWTRSEIEELTRVRPEFGVALLRTLARRTIDIGARLENCLGEKTASRVLRSLIRFSERSATAAVSGTVRMAPLTHRMISEYVGTTREVVTQHMNRFRRQGLLEYSRAGITLMPRAFQIAGVESRVAGLRTLERRYA